MNEKIRLSVPVIVEGRYDKAKLANIIDGVIIPTNGFGVFNNQEKVALLRRLSGNGLIFLCDSDGAGTVIRRHLKGLLNGVKVYDLYTAQVKGVEKRKSAPSKAGFLGVEGIDDEELAALFRRLLETHPELGETAPEALSRREITKVDFFTWGLTGTPDAAQRRNQLCAALKLPKDMTPNALLSAVNMIATHEEIEAILESLNP